MRADVKKPIQSLHSFGRHFYGRSIAALLPLFFLQLVFAEPQDTNGQSTEEKRLDLLFSKIMQSMPEEVKSEVDSAAAVDIKPRTVQQEKKTENAINRTTTLKTRMHELPDDVKAEIEHTISDMQKRKEARKAQFRETRKPRH